MQSPEDDIVRVELTANALVVQLAGGRVFAVPFDAVPTLAQASIGERYQYRIATNSLSVEWSALRTRLTVDDLLRLANKSLNPVPR